MFARRAASETPTSSLFCGEPLILTEPPGPCGAGRLCVVCGPTGVLCNSVRVRGWIACGPRVFRAPSGPAAREARRPHCVRRRASKPARALRSLRRPPHQWGQVAVVWFGASSGSPARPSGPSGTLHTSGAWCADVWLGALSRRPARPCRRPRVPPSGPVDQVGRLSETVIAFACWYLCGSETGIAFAGAKWAYLLHFSGAVVMSVSAVPCWG